MNNIGTNEAIRAISRVLRPDEALDTTAPTGDEEDKDEDDHTLLLLLLLLVLVVTLVETMTAMLDDVDDGALVAVAAAGVDEIEVVTLPFEVAVGGADEDDEGGFDCPGTCVSVKAAARCANTAT